MILAMARGPGVAGASRYRWLVFDQRSPEALPQIVSTIRRVTT